MREEHIKLIGDNKHLLTEEELSITEKRILLFKEREQLKRLKIDMKILFEKKIKDIENLIEEKRREIYSFECTRNEHMWDRDEANIMGNGTCIICGHDDY